MVVYVGSSDCSDAPAWFQTRQPVEIEQALASPSAAVHHHTIALPKIHDLIQRKWGLAFHKPIPGRVPR